MAADLITLAEGALLTQFLTPTAKHYGETTLKRIQQLGGWAKAMLTGVGREPQGIDEKILVPLVQGAGLESDPTLAEKWAALLANAADPAQRVTVQPSFTDVLRQLTVDDAAILAFIYSELEQANKSLIASDIYSHFTWGDIRLEVSINNLLRLRLVDALAAATFGPLSTLRDKSNIGRTMYGQQFLVAVTPPAA